MVRYVEMRVKRVEKNRHEMKYVFIKTVSDLIEGINKNNTPTIYTKISIKTMCI